MNRKTAAPQMELEPLMLQRTARMYALGQGFGTLECVCVCVCGWGGGGGGGG